MKLLQAIIVIVCLGIVGVSLCKTGNIDNPVADIAEDIIEKETGVDIDKLLPSDK